MDPIEPQEPQPNDGASGEVPNQFSDQFSHQFSSPFPDLADQPHEQVELGYDPWMTDPQFSAPDYDPFEEAPLLGGSFFGRFFGRKEPTYAYYPENRWQSAGFFGWLWPG